MTAQDFGANHAWVWAPDRTFAKTVASAVTAMGRTLTELASDPQQIPELLPVYAQDVAEGREAAERALAQEVRAAYPYSSQKKKEKIYEQGIRLLPVAGEANRRINLYNLWVNAYNSAVQGICAAREMGLTDEAIKIAAGFCAAARSHH